MARRDVEGPAAVERCASAHPREAALAFAAAVLIAASIVVTLVAFAVPAGATMVLERRAVCASTAYQDEPDVSRPWIVWSDHRHGAWDIYAFDTGTRTERPVCTAAGDQTHPRIWGTWVVWQDRRDGGWDIYAYDLATDTEVAVCTAGGAQVAPRIEAGAIVWQDDRTGDWDLYGIDVADLQGEPQPLVVATGDQTAPDLSATWLVWVDDRGGDPDIWALDRSSPAAVPAAVTASGARQDQPAVSGSLVVWRDFRHLSAGSGTDLFARQLGSDLTWELLAAAGDQESPAVAGDVVVFTDYRRMAAGRTAFGPDVMGFDISLQEEVTVYGGVAAQNKPAIGGSDAEGFDVVWADWRSASRKTDPWWATLSPWTASIVVDGGAAWTKDPIVDLTLHAATNNPGAAIAEMSVADVGDPGAAAFVPYAAAVTGWDLTWPGQVDDGVYGVSAAFRDDSGLPSPGDESPTAVATVTLDTHPPVARAPYRCSGTRGARATVKYRADDALSPQAKVTIRIVTRGGVTKKTLRPGWVPTGRLLSKTFACRLAPGTYRVVVSARDLAGWADPTPATTTLRVR